MIKFQCDFCKRKTMDLETIVLYKKVLTYCDKCESKALELKEEMNRIIKYENVMYNAGLRQKESQLFKKIRRITNDNTR